MVSGAININTDPECGRVMDFDMVLSHSPGPNDIMSSVDIPSHPRQPGPSSSTTLDTKMVTGYGPDTGHPCGHW